MAQLLEGNGVKLLHDRRMPGSRNANIDHLAVGPGGITIIDTKNYRGKVRVERRGGLLSLLRHQTVRDVIIDSPRATAKLARRPGPLTTEHIERIRRHLAHVLPPA